MAAFPRSILTFAVVVATICLPASTTFGGDPPEERRDYNGASRELSVRGAFLPGRERLPAGWSVDAGFRNTWVMMLADARVSYTFSSLPKPSDDPSRPEQRHGLWGHALLHPFFFSLLGSEWFGYSVASIAFEIGLGATVETTSNQPAGPGAAWSIGGSLDLPLSDPDAGQSPWLLLSYRNIRPIGTGSPNRHAIFAGIGWRMNGSLF